MASGGTGTEQGSFGNNTPPEGGVGANAPVRYAGPTDAGRARVAANRFGVDYRTEAALLPAPPVPIVDFHAHINGRQAAAIYRSVAELFGISRVLTMVRLEEAAVVREVLGDFVRFIAFPDFRHKERGYAFKEGFLHDIQEFHDRHGARIVKLWNSPRMREFFEGDSGKDLIEFDSPWRLRAAELAQSLGMIMMVHVADPDTWFKAKYTDPAKYGRKIDHYRGLEVALDRFAPMPWVAAHMGGWPEDLDYLDTLLVRHPNLYLDSSATKWIVRELSLQPRERIVEFLTRWQGRILFGSDIVTLEEHMTPRPADTKPASPMSDLADSPASAFDLYASRYYALRLMFETCYDGESPIADPDLKMLAEAQGEPLAQPLSDLAAPRLRGLLLPAPVLRSLYRGAAETLLATVGVVV